MSVFDDKMEKLKDDITGHLDEKLKLPLDSIRQNQVNIKDLFRRSENNKLQIKEFKGMVAVVNEKTKGNRRVIAWLVGLLTVIAGCLITYALTNG